MQSSITTKNNKAKLQSNNKGNAFFITLTILVSLLYILLEITLNFSLVSLYSHSITEIFLNQNLADKAHNIEMYGRIISGFGFSMLLFPYIYKKLPENWRNKFSISLLLRSFLFVAIWVTLILAIRFIVELGVYQTSEKNKLDSVRSIMFKELYGAGQLNFPDLTVLNEAAKDPLQKKILTALIPSLAFVSPEVNKTIEDKTDEIAVFLLNKREREKFEEKVSPILERNLRKIHAELKLYEKYYQEFDKSNWLLSNKSAFNNYRNEHLAKANNKLEASWNTYNTSVNGIPEYTAIKSVNLIENYVSIKKRYHKKKCYRKNEKYCNTHIYSAWNKLLTQQGIPTKTPEFWFDTSWWGVFKKLALLVPAVFESVACDIITEHKDRYCGALAKEFEGLDNRLKQARIEQLSARYPFGLTLQREQYLQQASVQKEAANYLRKQGIKVATTWTTANKKALTNAVKKQLLKRDAVIQKSYNSKSRLDLKLGTPTPLSEIDFYKTRQAQSIFKKNLGKYYYKGFLPTDSDAKVFLAWQNKKPQSNLNIVKMLTHKAEYGFKAGGMFYDLGIDAVKFSIIPTVSIIISVIGVLLITIKCLVLPLYYFDFGQRAILGSSIKVWMLMAILLAIPILAIPVFNSHYIQHIGSSLNKSSQSSNKIAMAKNYALGYVLDAQSNLFQVAGKFEFDLLGEIPKDYFQSIKSVDDVIFDELNGYSHYLFPIDKVKKSTLNLTIYRKEYDLLLAMGIDIEDQKVKQVSIPTIFTNNQLDLLFDSRMLYGAKDYKMLFKTSLSDARDPEFWVSAMSSDLIRQTMREKLEEKIALYLNSRYPKGISSLKFVPKGKDSGNIILVNHKRKKYDCYYLPPFNFTNLIAIFSSTNLNTAQEKFRCKWDI